MEFLTLLGLIIPIGVACLIFWPNMQSKPSEKHLHRQEADDDQFEWIDREMKRIITPGYAECVFNDDDE